MAVNPDDHRYTYPTTMAVVESQTVELKSATTAHEVLLAGLAALAWLLFSIVLACAPALTIVLWHRAV